MSTKNESVIKGNIVRTSFFNFLSSIFVKLGSLILSIFLARLLMPENYGLYSGVLAIAMVFYSLSDLGINSVFFRYGALAEAINKKDIHTYYSHFYRLKFSWSLVSSILLLLLAYPLSYLIINNSSFFLPLIAASFYIFFLSLETFYTQIYYIIEKGANLVFKEFLSQTIKIILCFLALTSFSKSSAVFGVITALSVSSAMMLGFAIYSTRSLSVHIYNGEKRIIDKKKIGRFSKFMAIYSITTVIFGYVDSLVLTFFLQPQYLGYYRASFALIWGFTALMAFPNISVVKLFTFLKDYKLANNFINRMIKYYAIVIFPCVALVISLSKYLILFFYGLDYLEATQSLTFLSLLIFPATLAGFAISIFSAKETPEIFSKVTLFIFLFSFFINILFIKLFNSISPTWATAGVSLATSLVWYIYSTLLFIFLKRKFYKGITFKQVIGPAIGAILVYIISKSLLVSFRDVNLLNGLFIVIVSLVFYGFFIRFSKILRNSEIKFIVESLKYTHRY